MQSMLDGEEFGADESGLVGDASVVWITLMRVPRSLPVLCREANRT